MKYVYYAHSSKIYGTPREKSELAAIRKLFPDEDVWNPNGDADDPRDSECYRKAVREAAAVVATEHVGHVGRGVASNIGDAIVAKVPVFVLRDGALYVVKSMDKTKAQDWAIRYATIVAGKKVQEVKRARSRKGVTKRAAKKVR